MGANTSDQLGNTLFDLITGHRLTAIIAAAVELNIADQLFEGPKTSDELARETSAHEPSLLRLMRALAAMAICTESADGTFALTDMGTLLASKAERSIRPWAIVEVEMLRAGWVGLVESIRTGKTATELAGLGQERFERLAETKYAAMFNQGVASITRLAMPVLLSACDFSGIATLMDVGGGIGELMAALLRKYPSMRGIVFDLPHSEEAARRQLAAAGVAERAKFVAGSFFESVPGGADAIVMKSIIHDWNDERCARILRNCHRALKPGSRLTVIDRVVPDRIEPTAEHMAAVLSDLNMLRGPGGSERTECQHRALLNGNGFRVTQIVPAGRYALIEAVAE